MSPLHILENDIIDRNLPAVAVVLSAVLETVILSVTLIVLEPRIIHRVGRVELVRVLRVGFRRDIRILRELEMSRVGIAVGSAVAQLADGLI